MIRHCLILCSILLIISACTTSAYGVVVVVVPVQRQVTTTTATPQLPDPTPTQEIATFPTPRPLTLVYNPTESRWHVRDCDGTDCLHLGWLRPGDIVEADLFAASGTGFVQVYRNGERWGWVHQDGIAVWPGF